MEFSSQLLFRIIPNCSLITILLLFANVYLSNAQDNVLQVTPFTSADVTDAALTDLFRDMLRGSDCMDIQSARLVRGDRRQLGIFTNGMATVGMETGLIMSTGFAEDAEGPNNSTSTSGVVGSSISVPQDFGPNMIIRDAVVIELTVATIANNSLHLDHVISSEVHALNDFYGECPDAGALVDFFSIRSVQDLGCTANIPDQFVVTEFGDPDCIGNFETFPFFQYIEYDTVGQIDTKYFDVESCCYSRYRIELGDVGDRNYDTAVFFGEGSIRAGFDAKSIGGVTVDNNSIYETCDGQELAIAFSRPTIVNFNIGLGSEVDFSIGGTATNGVDYVDARTNQAVTSPFVFDEEKIIDTLFIKILSDNLAEGTETLIISQEAGNIGSSALPSCGDCDIEINIIDNTSDLNVFISGNTNSPCAGDIVNLDAISNGEIGTSTYLWSNGDTGTSLSDIITQDQTYSLTITDECGNTAEDNFEVTVSNVEVQINPPALLSCAVTSINLSTNINDADIYNWSSSNGFTSNLAAPNVSEAGTYMVTITDDNGCTGEAVVEVVEDFEIPDILTFSNGDIDCTNPTVTLETSSSTPNVSYQWIFQGETISNNQMVDVSSGGIYEVIVTNTDNACSSSETIIVAQNDDVPSVVANNINGSSMIDCTNALVEYEGTTDDPTATITWTSPDGTESNNSILSATSGGIYTFTVTALNGCTNESTVTILENVEVPDVIATGGDISCVSSFANLEAISTTPSIEFNWSGPGIVNPLGANQTVSIGGTYSVIATNTMSGCTEEVTTFVAEDTDAPNINASTSNDLNCSNASTTLFGNSTTTGATFNWTGPNNFSSNAASPTDITEPGFYNLAVFAPNGCVADTLIEVTLDNAIPIIVTSVSGMIDCAGTPVNLIANSNSIDDTFFWSGPNGFTSNEISPSVNQGGDYTLTVTSTNGCASTETVNVEENNEVPEIAISTPSVQLDCINPSTILESNSNDPNVSYQWTSDNGFTESTPNPEITEAGIYTLIVTNSIDCTAISSIEIFEDFNAPQAVSAPNQTIDCIGNPNLEVFSTSTNLTYQWTGPNGFMSNEISPVATEEGNYVVVLTGQNGCSESTSLEVVSDFVIPNINANGDIITCENQSAQLTGSSTSSNVTYMWTGPGSFESMDQNPIVNNPGEYTLTVTGENGCIASTQIEVPIDDDAPTAIASSLGGPGVINCNQTSVQISGSTNDPSASLMWTFPDGTTNTDLEPIVTQGGTYILTVAALNGCVNQATVEILEDLSTPENIETTGGTIFCDTPSLELSATSSSSSIAFEWSGPNGFESSISNPTVDEPGIYTVTIIGPNGCSDTDIVEVDTDNEIPDLQLDNNENILSCTESEIQLSANSSETTVVYSWSGPNGFTSVEQTPFVTTAGVYEVIATNTINGCTNMEALEVFSDTDIPIINIEGETLSCAISSFNFNTTSSDPTVSYDWVGPNGFTSSEQNPLITMAGEYTLMVSSSNGCSTSSTTTVILDDAIPAIYIELDNDMIDCNTSSVELIGTSTDNNATYNWTGPNVASTSDNNIVATEGGIYELTIVGLNGCTASETVEIIEDFVSPQSVSAPNQLIDCNGPVTLEVFSSSPIVMYDWTGPNGFNSIDATPTINEPGNYTILLTGTNGCTETAMVEVEDGIITPNLQVNSSNDELTCTELSIDLMANSSEINVIYEWSGPGGFSSNSINPTINSPGDYMVTLTNNTNGCTNSQTINIGQDIQAPTINLLQPSEINCFESEVTIDASSSIGQGDLSYNWTTSNGNIIAGNINSNLVVDAIGSYQLEITDVDNGCTALGEINIQEDIDSPNLEILTPLGNNMITCSNPTVTLEADSDIDDLTYDWTGPNGTGIMANYEADQAGIYNAIVTNNLNGCTSELSINISADLTVPVASIETPLPLNCNETNQTLLDASNSANGEISWSLNGNPLNTLANLQESVTEAGIYELSILNPDNGCEGLASVEVINLEEAQINANLIQCDPLNTITANLPPNTTGIWYTDGTVQVDDFTNPLTTLVNPNYGENTITWALSSTEFDCPDYSEQSVSIYDYANPPFSLNDTIIDLQEEEFLLYEILENENLQNFDWVENNIDITKTPILGNVELLGEAQLEYQLNSSSNSQFDSFTYSITDPCGNIIEQNVTLQFKTVDNTNTTIIITPPGDGNAADGLNDYLHLDGVEDNLENEVHIFNRWGSVVWETQGYDNNINRWAGTNYSGNPLPEATYYFVAKININEKKIITGSVTIKRTR